MESRKARIITECPHCYNRTTFEVRAEYTQKGISDQVLDQENASTTWSILQCLACLQPTFYERTDYVFPGLTVRSRVLYPASKTNMDSLPGSVEKAYRAALKVRDIEPNACAVLVGRTLEVVCKQEKAEGKTLAEKLDHLARSGRIPQLLAQMAHQLRQIRNLGAHLAEDEVTKEDVPIILDFVEAILEYLYQAPAKIAAVQARLKKAP